ncbi:Gfo/Idh/MocA family protein [Microbacterium sp.]|uniref:Gfo/Idh/MocA family protein n=1 Tax=Microbacterium sp. TaxID=51671 RepID=UPI0037CB6F56
MDEIGLIQVGAGVWGTSWAAKIAAMPGVRLDAVVDVQEEAARSIAEESGLGSDRAFASLTDALASTDAAGVVVVSPPPTHTPLALEAIAAGKHVLIEKPLAQSVADARRVVDAARSAGIQAMVSQNYRFKRGPRTVQRLIRSGVIGRVEQVTIAYRKNPPFFGFRAEMEEPLLIDMSIHHLDALRGIVGVEPATVRARSWNPSWSIFTSNSAALVEIEGTRGEQVLYTGSWSSHGAHTSWDGAWQIEGERGGIVWDQNRVTVHFPSAFDTVFMPGALERDGVMEVDLDQLEHEERAGTLNEFRRAIVEGTPAETSVDDNLASISLVLAAVESARGGGTTIALANAEKGNQS